MSAEARELLDPKWLARLERLDLNLRKMHRGDRLGDLSAQRSGLGTLFREHRAYIPGDDPRFLDWNAFLRFGALHVKELEAEEAPRMQLLIDGSASMGLGQGVCFGQALRIASALAALALRRNASVGISMTPHERPPWEGHGRGALLRLLQHLAEAKPAGASRFLPTARMATPRGRAAGMAVVLSDFFETEEYEAALRLLRQRGHQVHALHLVDERATVQAGQLLDLVDVETGRHRRQRIDADLAAAYSETVRRHFEEVRARCRALRVGYHRLSATADIEEAVRTFIGRGGILR